ncbi:hypothetical protein SLEP1_g39368 [Rubroshorea leprosula]|uniref:Uncharacterized protein n=1 Tax=Rubroshorea leprosula TaxID=152421 RepID=A0AAV5L151_9ROSI|nr:hypothetical protein SLEP1_g39368 [Rubroshorea leprosula]
MDDVISHHFSINYLLAWHLFLLGVDGEMSVHVLWNPKPRHASNYLTEK